MEREDNYRKGGEGEFSSRPRQEGERRGGPRKFDDRSRGSRREYGDRPRSSRGDYGDRPRGPRRDFGDKPRQRQYGEDQREPRQRQFRQRQTKPMYNRPSEQRDQMIFGIHAISEALKAGEPIDFIYVKRETNSDMMKELLEAIGEQRVPVRRVPIEKLDRLTKRNHQGIIAVKAAAHYFSLSQVVPTLFEAGRDPFIVVLDGITDVRNFGAIARTCECAGVDTIVIFEQNSVSVTSDAVKTSAGALSRIAVCRESSVESVIDYLKASGIKIVGASEKATGQMYDVKMSGPLALIMGAEDTGLSEYSLNNCDDLVRIPLFGEIGSLNVSVATGILLYEAVRQKS